MDKTVNERKAKLEAARVSAREDPHGWANWIEEWLNRQGMHIGILYLLAGIGLIDVVWDIIGWLDDVVTGRI